jgi:cobalt-zinc-cadmium efflux system protein
VWFNWVSGDVVKLAGHSDSSGLHPALAHGAAGREPECACQQEHTHEHPHQHSTGHSHVAELRRASGRALWGALVILAVFFVVELVGGILTNSLALVSDAAHLLTDVAAIGLALFAQWFAMKPASAARSFGYRRVEILAALLNGFTLILVAIYIGVEAWHRLRNPPPVLGLPMIVVASLGLLAQIGATVVLGRAQGENLNVRGAYVHALTDAVQSVGVVGAGAVMLATGWFTVDPLVSVAIGALVAYGGGRIIFEATHVLIEGTPREVDLDQIAALILGTAGVTRVTDLHAWSLTSGHNYFSAHVQAAPTPEDPGHDALRRELTDRLCSGFPLQHVTLQIEQECEQCRTSDCCGWLTAPEDKRG